ncbi:MAG: hypothetical protein GWP91_08125 [Rhodobacterales bacterium]|nr:hypothetical protein [Rhodobacterales bacterium]
MYLLSWLRRLTALSRLTWGSALLVFLFLFLGIPMLGPAVEVIADLLFPEHPLMKVMFFLSIPLITGLLTLVIVGETRLFHSQTQEGYMLPAPTMRLVFLASESMPDEATMATLMAKTERFELFEAVKRGKLGRGGWLRLVIRAMEHHRPALLQVVFIVSNDGLGAENHAADRARLEAFLRHYAELQVQNHGQSLAFHHVEVGFRHITFAVGFEETRRVVDALQEGIDAQDVIFDFTPGTKPMSAGMVMGCLDERYDLQYFMPLPGAEQRAEAVRHAQDHIERLHEGVTIAPLDPRSVGWGLLPIERVNGLALKDGGVMPLRIQTDPRPVLNKVEA